MGKGNVASVLAALRDAGVSADALESLECAELSEAQLLAIDDAQQLTDAEELGIDARDADAIVAALEALRNRERGPLIFLDIDGVLNRTVKATHVRLDDDLCARLAAVAAAAGAKVVLSTFWRGHLDYVAYALKRQGVEAPVVGATPGDPTGDGYDGTRPRADEIAEYLAACDPACSYVILDDRDDAAAGAMRDRFVRTDPAVGLSEGDAARAAALLAS